MSYEEAVAMLLDMEDAGVSVLVDPDEWVITRRRDCMVARDTLANLAARLQETQDE